MLPIAKRSADDLAALMVLSAQTWVELPPQTREDFELELAQHHNLWLFRATTPLPESDHDFLPYLMLLEDALRSTHRHADRGQDHGMGTALVLGRDPQRRSPDPHRLSQGAPRRSAAAGSAADAGRDRRAHPDHCRHPGTAHYPPAGATLRSGRRASARATRRKPCRKAGPEELASLARTFNHMALQVQELLANRTTLLAGISHDLRTPLARMRLALEMLPQGSRPQKRSPACARDMEEMNRLIGEFLDSQPRPGKGS